MTNYLLKNIWIFRLKSRCFSFYERVTPQPHFSDMFCVKANESQCWFPQIKKIVCYSTLHLKFTCLTLGIQLMHFSKSFTDEQMKCSRRRRRCSISTWKGSTKTWHFIRRLQPWWQRLHSQRTTLEAGWAASVPSHGAVRWTGHCDSLQNRSVTLHWEK